MTLRNVAVQSSGLRHDDQFKDEVYRQMFRLEANRPGADLALAVALLRGWLDADSGRGRPTLRAWLTKVCPICLSLIEASQPASDTDQRSMQ
jgi:hypothetical protein